MKIERTRHYPVSAQQLLALLTSKEYYQGRYRVSGIDDYRFEAFEKTSRGFLIRILRQLEIRSGSVPSFAKKFVGNRATLTTEFLWIEQEHQPYRAEYRFAFGKVPVQVRGTVKIQDEAEGCSEHISIVIDSSIPLIGNKLSALVGDKVDKGLDSDHRGTLRYIAEQQALTG